MTSLVYQRYIYPKEGSLLSVLPVLCYYTAVSTIFCTRFVPDKRKYTKCLLTQKVHLFEKRPVTRFVNLSIRSNSFKNEITIELMCNLKTCFFISFYIVSHLNRRSSAL